MHLRALLSLMAFEILLAWLTPTIQGHSQTDMWMTEGNNKAGIKMERRNRLLHQATQHITITAGPSQDEVVSVEDFPVVFEVPGNAPTECLFSRGPNTIVDWSPCTSPLSLVEYFQGEGQYTLRIRTVGDPAEASGSEAVLTFHVDLTEPDTVITSYSNSSNPTTFSFEFDGLNDDVDHFECDLDYSGNWERCRSPKTYTGLVYGEHVFAVRAVDIAGNADSTPATGLFRVEHPSRPSSALPANEALPSEISEDPNSVTTPSETSSPGSNPVSSIVPENSAEQHPIGSPSPSPTTSSSPSPGSQHSDASVDSASSNAAAPDDVSSSGRRNESDDNGARNETQTPTKIEEISSTSWYTIIIYVGVAVVSVFLVIVLVICCSKGQLSCCHVGINCCIDG